MNRRIALAISLIALFLITISAVHAEETLTLAADSDLLVHAYEILPRNPYPFENEFLSFESIQVRNNGTAPILCAMPEKLDNGDGRMSELEYWASIIHPKLSRAGTKFDNLVEVLALESLYPTDEILVEALDLMKARGLTTERTPTVFSRLYSKKLKGLCTVRVFDSTTAGSTLIKEFTLEDDIDPGKAVILSTDKEDYELTGTGMHTISVVVDPDNVFLEQNKTNNVAVLDINVEPFLPDLLFLTSEKIFNKGPAPAVCRRFTTASGSISPFESALADTPRDRLSAYLLLLDTVDFVQTNNSQWFNQHAIRSVYNNSDIFKNYYKDFEDSDEARDRVYERITKNILDRHNVNEYVQILGENYGLKHGFETTNFCKFGDSAEKETVCQVPNVLSADILPSGSFVTIKGDPAEYSHPNCLGIEDSDPSNDLFPDREISFIPTNPRLLTTLHLEIVPEGKQCDGTINTYVSTSGELWHLIDSTPTCIDGVCGETISKTVQVSNVFRYVKVHGVPCTLESSEITIESVNFGDPFSRISEKCSNGIGFSIPGSGYGKELTPKDLCAPGIMAHIHDLGGGVQEVLVVTEEATYIETPVPSQSTIEVLLEESIVASAGNTTYLEFYLKNSGLKALDQLELSAEFTNNGWVQFDLEEISLFNPEKIKLITASLDIPFFARSGAHTLTVNVKRADFIIGKGSITINVEKKGILLLYSIYALVGLGFISLVYTTLKFTGLHDKIFKKGHRSEGEPGRRRKKTPRPNKQK